MTIKHCARSFKVSIIKWIPEARGPVQEKATMKCELLVVESRVLFLDITNNSAWEYLERFPQFNCPGLSGQCSGFSTERTMFWRPWQDRMIGSYCKSSIQPKRPENRYSDK